MSYRVGTQVQELELREMLEESHKDYFLLVEDNVQIKILEWIYFSLRLSVDYQIQYMHKSTQICTVNKFYRKNNENSRNI